MASSGDPLDVLFVIRYDDYGAAYGPACPARFEVEQMLHRETQARGWPWLCGVTPRQSVDPHNVDNERTVRLSEDLPRVRLLRHAVAGGLCEPAVHGLTHHTWKQLPRWGTELAGLPVERQYEILRTARGEVEQIVGRPVYTFIPPWNSYDVATVEAVERAGMTLLSGGLASFANGHNTVRMVPATIELADLGHLMERGRRFAEGSVVVLMLHGTDFVKVDRESGHLEPEEFAPLVARAIEHFGMRVVPITGVPDLAGVDLGQRGERAAMLFHYYDHHLSELPVIGGRLKRWVQPHVSALLPTAAQRRVLGALSRMLFIWFAAVALLASAPGWLCVAVLSAGPWRGTGLAAAFLAGGGLTGYCVRNAFLKRYRKHWGTRRVGLRTWTGLTAGLALMLSALMAGLLSFLRGQV
jgi:hypothetical protein